MGRPKTSPARDGLTHWPMVVTGQQKQMEKEAAWRCCTLQRVFPAELRCSLLRSQEGTRCGVKAQLC